MTTVDNSFLGQVELPEITGTVSNTIPPALDTDVVKKIKESIPPVLSESVLSVLSESVPSVLSESVPSVLSESDTIPPAEPLSEETGSEMTWDIRTPEQRAADRNNRINAIYNKVLPKIREQKLGVDSRQPWLSSPIVEQVVKATLEALYDLNIEQ
jgi:hypothetical protein